MTTREELLTALTGSVIDDGLYVAEVTPQQAEAIAELVWPFLEKAWAEGVQDTANRNALPESETAQMLEENPYLKDGQ